MNCFGLLASLGKELLPLFLMKLHKSVLIHLFIPKQWVSCPSIRNRFSHKFSVDFRLIPTDLVGFRSDVKIQSHLLQKRLSWIKSVLNQKSRGFVVTIILFRLTNRPDTQFCERRVLPQNTVFRAILVISCIWLDPLKAVGLKSPR